MESSVETSQIEGPSNPKPVLALKPLLTPKPFSLQKNTTFRSIHAPKTLPAKSKIDQTEHAAVTTVPKLTLPISAQKPPQPTSTSHSKPWSASVPTTNQPETPKESEAGPQQVGTLNSSAEKSDPPIETAPPKETSKSEPIQKDDVIQTNHKTDTEANSELEDGKKEEDQTQPSVTQKPAESGGRSPSTTPPAYRWASSRKRLSMELTSKFEAGGVPLFPQPAAATNTNDDLNKPVSSNSVHSQTKPEPSEEENEDSGQKEDYSGGDSIKRRISLFESSSRPEVMTKKEELEIINGTGGGVKELIKNWAAEESSEVPKIEKKLPQIATRDRSRSFESTTAPAEEIPQVSSVEHSATEKSSIQTEDPVLKVLPAKQPTESQTKTPTDAPSEDKSLESRTEAPEQQTKSTEHDVQPQLHSPSTTSTVTDKGISAASENNKKVLKREGVKQRCVRFGIVERDDGGPPLILGSASESSTEEEEDTPDDEVEEEVSVPVYRGVGILQRKDNEIQRQEEERLQHLEFEKRRREEENEQARLKLEEQQKHDKEEREKEKKRLKEEETQRQQLNEKEIERQRNELERLRLEEEKRENERLREEEMERERQVELMWQRQREEERERAKQKEKRLKEDQEEKENERLREEEERLAQEHKNHQLKENVKEDRIREEKHTEEVWVKKTEMLAVEGEEKRKKQELMWQRQKEEDRERSKLAEERLRQEEREKERLRAEEEERERCRRLEEEERMRERLRQEEEEERKRRELELMWQRQKEDRERAKLAEERLRQEEREKERLRAEEEERERCRRLEEEERMRERLRQEEEEEERKRRELERKMQQKKEEEMERMRQIEKQKEEDRREEERMRQVKEEIAKELENKLEEELERKRADELKEKLRRQEEKEIKVLESSIREEESVEDKPEQNLICLDPEDLAQSSESTKSSSPTAQVPTERLIDVVYDDFSVKKPLIDVDFDDFSVKPKRRGSKPRVDTTPIVQAWDVALMEKEEVKELVPLDVNPPEDNVPEQADKPDSPVPTEVQENPEEEEVEEVEKSIPDKEELMSFEVEEEEEKVEEEEEKGTETEEEKVETKEEGEDEEEDQEDQHEAQVNSYCTNKEDKDTEVLIDNEPEQQDGVCEETCVSDSPTPVPDQVPEASSEDVDTDLPELAPFPESTAPLLDTSVQRSKADLGKRRNRSRRSRSVHGELVQTEKLDWRAHDSTDGKDAHSKQESDSEEEQPKPKTVCSPPPSSQRVPMFPGMSPAALIAQLKKRTGGGGTGGVDETEEDKEKDKESPNEEVVVSPSYLSRSPRLAAQLAGAARVLPPLAGKDGGAVSSPAWLKELKSKKRLSQHEGDA